MTKTIKAVVVLAEFVVATAAWTGLAVAQVGGGAPPAVTPSVSGTVQQYRLNPAGEVDGLLLADGTVITFPPHLGTTLASTVRPGDPVTATGFLGPSTPHGRAIKALTITNTASSRTVVDQPPAQPRPPKHMVNAALQPLTVSGRVTRVLVNAKGEVDGLVLSGGEMVKVKAREGAMLAALLQRTTSPITVSGSGTRGGFGTVVEAASVTVDGQTFAVGGKGKKR